MEIDSGGAISVDPDQLRDMAGGVLQQVPIVRQAASTVRCATEPLLYRTMPTGASALYETGAQMDGWADRLTQLATSMNYVADIYEMVELRVRDGMPDVPIGLDLPLTDERMRELEQRSPGASLWAQVLLRQWKREHGQSAYAQLAFGPGKIGQLAEPFFPGFGATFELGIYSLLLGAFKGLELDGGGRIAYPSIRRGTPAPDPEMNPVPVTTTKDAPKTVADVIQRIPDEVFTGDEHATMRVERYTMPDGSKQYALFITGTQSDQPGTVLDWPSNAALYTGGDSQALHAAHLALEAAGAQPGDTIHVSGHSQGAMIASIIAAEQTYDVSTLVTVGSPVQVDPQADTLSVNLRHDDDLVGALAQGGYPYEVGAEGSVIVSGEYDAQPRIGDITFDAHRLPGYVELANEFDASGDPSAAAIHERLAPLQEATRIDVFEFDPQLVAERSDREAGAF
ncbi:MAG: hypothetical protein QM607_10595 [Microbacterium sp.]